jgi:hypothetical protein
MGKEGAANGFEAKATSRHLSLFLDFVVQLIVEAGIDTFDRQTPNHSLRVCPFE